MLKFNKTIQFDYNFVLRRANTLALHQVGFHFHLHILAAVSLHVLLLYFPFDFFFCDSFLQSFSLSSVGTVVVFFHYLSPEQRLLRLNINHLNTQPYVVLDICVFEFKFMYATEPLQYMTVCMTEWTIHARCICRVLHITYLECQICALQTSLGIANTAHAIYMAIAFVCTIIMVMVMIMIIYQ